MASPTFVTSAVSDKTSAANPQAINYPASLSVGNTLICVARAASAGAMSATGWTELYDNDTGDGGTDQTWVAWRKVDGGEGATFNLTVTSSKVSAIVWQFSGASDPATTPPEIGTWSTSGGSNTPDPPNLAPTGGSQDYMFIATYTATGENAVVGYPTNYTTGQAFSTTGTGAAESTNTRTQGGVRAVTGTAENPGAFGSYGAGRPNSANTIAVYPAPAGGGPTRPNLMELLGVS